VTRILPLKAGAGSTLSAGATLARLRDAALEAGQPRRALKAAYDGFLIPSLVG
jgi:hypothetical protein